MKDIPSSYGLYIDGKEQASASGKSFAVLSAWSREKVASIAEANEIDVDSAIRAARKAYPAWAEAAPVVRETVLLKAADMMAANCERLVKVLIEESGSTAQKARFEVNNVAARLRTAAGEASRLYGDTFPNDKPHRMSIVIREPIGVVVTISPFNASLALLAKMSIYALAAGNTVVAKPASETPLIAVEFAKILSAAGLPDGCFNVVPGPGKSCGDALINHAGIDGIAFTGSTEVGSRIAAVGAAKMRRMQMELGGKNPLIVLGDVDPAKAAAIAAAGAFYHAGQICMASTRIIVEQSVLVPFVKAMAAKACSLKFGAPEDSDTAYGPVINEAALAKIISHVDGARANGAEIVCGGAVERGLIYQPTIVLEPPRDRGVWREETFGPVASVAGVKDLDEAIALANDSEYGLSAGVLTNDMVRALTAARKIRAGAVHLGTHSFQSDSLSPVGGIGASGFGRSGGKYSVEHFTELKWISIELGETPLPF